MAEYDRTIGRYEIGRQVGSGTMSNVYRAVDPALGREVILKELKPFESADAVSANRFLREGQVLARLNHPNIVTIYEMFEVGDRLYIAMEYMPRGSLRAFLPGLTAAQLISVLQGVLSGLAYAHSAGVVHHDLKPENVLVTSGGSVKITNFGMARVRAVMDARGRLVSTPRYMAPELVLGNAAGPPADLYSLGIMAYEMFTGKTPFEDAESAIALMLRRVHEDAPPPIALNHDLDSSLSAWTAALVERDPTNRPASATAALEALENLAVNGDSAVDDARPQDQPTRVHPGGPNQGSYGATARKTRTRVFVSYSHKDRKWLERLQVHMKPLIRQGTVYLWDDSHIQPASDWRSEIRGALSSARVAILLISADFLASDFIAEEELPRLLRAAEDDGALILPVIVSPSRFSDTALSRFQAVNSPTTPLIAMKTSDREQTFVRLTAAVEQALLAAT